MEKEREQSKIDNPANNTVQKKQRRKKNHLKLIEDGG